MGAQSLDHALRVVLDTNIVVSALVFASGRLSWLRHQWQQGAIVPLVTHDTTDELIRVLSYPKFRLSSEDVKALLGDYLPFYEVVDIRDSEISLPEVRDPNDRIFLAAASAGNAGYLITGDDDLLAIRANFAIPIITAAELGISLGVRE